MVISELLKKGVTLIEGKEYTDPILESILVLSKLLQVDKSYIYIHLDKEVDEDIVNLLKLWKRGKQATLFNIFLKKGSLWGLISM